MLNDLELPSNWITIPVGDAVKSISTNGKKIPQKQYVQEGVLPVIDQGQDFIGGYTNDLSLKIECSLPAIVFGDHTRIVKYVNQSFAAGADGVKVLQPKKFFDTKLLTYFIKYVSSVLPNHGYARHYQHLSKESLPLPPIKEQNRIVDKIEALFSELDQGIDNLKTAQAQLKVYRQALLKHAFEGKLTAEWRAQNADKLESAETLLTRIAQARTQRYQEQLNAWQANKTNTGKPANKPKAPKPLAPLTPEELAELPELPEGWGWVKLGNFIESIDAGKSFKCDEREPLEGEIGVAKVSAVTWGEYNESESKTCYDSTKINEAYLIKQGDFILSRANTIELVGASVIVKKVSKKIMLSDKTLRIVFGIKNQEYFLHFLRSRFGRKQIMALSTGNQDSMRNIGQERIQSIIVPISSLDEMQLVAEDIEAKLSQIEQLEQTITTALQQADALRQSILKKAFSGQLVPQDPNDEPASVLLARIKSERATKR